MADDQAFDPTSGNLHPELGQIPATPGVQDWMAGAVSAIQDHVTARSIAANAQAQGDEFINALSDTKQNLVGMAKSDPSSVPLAFDLVDSFPEHMAPFGAHFKEEIAKSAVQGLAETNRDAAHAAIDKYADYIPEGDQAALRTYADHFETLRGLDAQAGQLEFNKNLQRASNIQAEAHLNDLQEPQTGTLRFPQGWGTRVMTDGKLSPQAKATLIGTYTNLQANGDPVTSDPHLVADLLQRAALPAQHGDHPDPLEIFGQAGAGLTISDAQYLSSRTGPQPPAARADTQALADAMQDARGMIGNDRAWGRFVQWALPAAKQGGLVLDPTSKDYSLAPERMQRFMPTGDDVIAPALRQYAGEMIPLPYRAYPLSPIPVTPYRGPRNRPDDYLGEPSTLERYFEDNPPDNDAMNQDRIDPALRTVGWFNHEEPIENTGPDQMRRPENAFGLPLDQVKPGDDLDSTAGDIAGVRPASGDTVVNPTGTSDTMRRITPEDLYKRQNYNRIIGGRIEAAIQQRRPSLGQIFAGNAPPVQPNKPWSTEPYDKGDDRYTEKGGPVKIPGTGNRPF